MTILFLSKFIKRKDSAIYGKNQAVGESRRRAVNTQTSLLMKQNVPHGFAFKRKKIRAMCSITGRLYLNTISVED